MKRRIVYIAFVLGCISLAAGSTVVAVRGDVLIAILVGQIFAIAVLIPAAVLLIVRETQSSVYRSHRKIEKRLERLHRHTLWNQAIPRLYEQLAPTATLPIFGTYALAPDQADYLVSLIRQRSPRNVVELGSGVSTVVIALALRRVRPDWSLVSIDHEDFFAQRTRDWLELHQLSERASVIHAPLSQLAVPGLGDVRQWYDTRFLNEIEDKSVDFLVIDGPPGHTCDMARLPALYHLQPKLAPDCIVVVDDVVRDDDLAMIQTWRTAFTPKRVKVYPLSKPTAVLEFGA